MNKEELKQTLVEEGFPHIYEWHDEPGVTYEPHAHTGAVAMYILDGGLTFQFDDSSVVLTAGERFDVPVGKEHTAVVGTSGCTFLVGEMIEGDS